MINNYALIKNGKVENIIIADSDFVVHIQSQWDNIINIDELNDKPAIGWNYSNNSFVNTIVAESPTQEEITRIKIKKSMEKGQEIIKDIAYLNIINNRSEAQISAMIGDSNNMKILSLLSSGALITAKAEIQNLDQTYFTVEEKNSIINSIDSFLVTL
jgi:hypothetical protein